MAPPTIAPKVCIIQTAFPGDVVLALGLVETIKALASEATIHFVVRDGNQGLLKDHPYITQVHVWHKRAGKFRSIWALGKVLRVQQFDVVINAQRFFSSGLIAYLAGAKTTIGFRKNPLSFLYSHKVEHNFGPTIHETDRNHGLILALWPSATKILPKLYPSPEDFAKVQPYQASKYICIAPASVWFTKQWPANQWIDFLDHCPPNYRIYILGGPTERTLGDQIMASTTHPSVQNLAGSLSFLASAALMAKADMNYTCDSAPLHIAGAMAAPVRAIFCSTVPAFGFGPMSAFPLGGTIQTTETLSCRPCGLHGHKTCPEGHFRCATSIAATQLLEALPLS